MELYFAKLFLPFLFICFLLSLFLFKIVGKPYNGLFVLVSFLLFVGYFMIKHDNITLKTRWISFLQNRIDTLNVQQNQLTEVVEGTIELIELERKMPKPAVWWGPEIDKKVKEFDVKIDSQKVKLRKLSAKK